MIIIVLKVKSNWFYIWNSTYVMKNDIDVPQMISIKVQNVWFDLAISLGLAKHFN